MTGAAVFNQALREVCSLGLTSASQRDFVAALEAPLPGPSDLLYELAHEAALSRDELLTRSAGLYCSFAAGNLADDLIDGDCDYLSGADAIGPSVQFGLQNLAYSVLLRSAAARAAVESMALDLAVAGGAEHLERGDWTIERFMDVAEGIAGLQWRAYLKVVWAGTGRDDAEDLGRILGIALHVAEDIRTKDRRFASLPPTDQREVYRWGLQLADQLQQSGSRCLATVATSVRSVCQRAPQ